MASSYLSPVGAQFGPRLPWWIEEGANAMRPGGAPRLPTRPAPPVAGAGPAAGPAQPGAGAPAPPPWWQNSPWNPQRLPPQPTATPGNANPWSGPNANAKDTPISTGVDAITAANIAGIYNPNMDPLLDRIMAMASMDNAGRQNAMRLQARGLGGDDPYLQAFAALTGGMQGQSDLARLRGSAGLERGMQREQFFQELLQSLAGGGYGIYAADRARPRGSSTGDIVGGLIGSAMGAVPWPWEAGEKGSP